MVVKEKEYFHIHRIGSHTSLWSIGNRINWVQKKNNIFFDFYNKNGFIFNDGEESLRIRSALNKYKNSSNFYKEKHQKNLILYAHDVIKSQSMYIREIIFEEVRKNYFPHLPSRQTGIWVCEKNAINYWWKALKANNELKVLKLRLTGTIHIASDKFLVADTFRHDDLRAYAFEYWTGVLINNEISNELLFEGIIDVIDEFKSLEDLNKKME